MRPPAAAAFVCVVLAVTGLSSFFAFSPQHSGSPAFWIWAAGPTVALSAIAAAWAWREGLLKEWLSPQWGDFTRGLAGAAVLFGAAWGFARVVAPVGSAREIWLVSLYGQIGDPRTLQGHAPMVAAGVAVTALAEEVLWRGAMTELVASRVGSRTAWLWTAGLYALAHAPAAWSLRGVSGAASLNPVLAIAALGLGLVCGGMARAFGRLAPGVLAHALFDWAVVMMFPLWGER